MPSVPHAGALLVSIPLALGGLVVGVWAISLLDLAAGRIASGRALGANVIVEPVRLAARALLTEHRATEAPDAPARVLGPTLLLTTAALATLVVPLGPGLVLADVNVGIVYFSAFLIVAMVAVFLTGWGPNSVAPMIAAYRFVGVVLAYGSAFAIAIISVALPAESLRIGEIVASQGRGLWNAVLQPLGFAIYLVLGAAITFWGPLDVVGPRDLGGGVRAELSGGPALVWGLGRYTLLLAVSAMGAVLFLGGWHGPWLPAPVWTILKTLGLAAGFVVVRHRVPTVRTESFMRFGWVVLLPASLANVFLVGLVVLVFPTLGRG